MSKTITVQAAYPRHPDDPYTLTVDVVRLAAFAPHLAWNRKSPIPDGRWIDAGLVAWDHDGGAALTPRGEDLVASIDCIPDDPEPEAPKPAPCKACDGTGKRPLFVSINTCDVCGGSGNQAAADVHAWTITLGDYRKMAKTAFFANHMISITRVDDWRVDGLPKVGHCVEVEVKTGERLRGCVTFTSHVSDRFCLAGAHSAPASYRGDRTGGTRWITGIAGVLGDDDTRVRWRYLPDDNAAG